MLNSKKTAFKSALDFSNRQLIISQEIIASQIALLTEVKSALPKELARHVLHCVQSDKKLLIYTESSSWASQIRFFSMDILTKINAAKQLKLSSIQLRIFSELSYQISPRTAKLPSSDSLEILNKQFKNSDVNNDILKQALHRLVKTLNVKTGRTQ